MESMFDGCKSLKLVDLSSFNTSLITNMKSMLCGCTNLTSLNLSNFNTENIIQVNIVKV